MKAAVNLLWVLLSILGAVALAHLVGGINPHEKVNVLWLVVAAACIYVLAYRFCGRWLARQVVELNSQRMMLAVRMNDEAEYSRGFEKGCEGRIKQLQCEHFLQDRKDSSKGSGSDTTESLDEALAVNRV
jgi:hypothetical protein